jgi:lysophospholipase L1-like esterase
MLVYGAFLYLLALASAAKPWEEETREQWWFDRHDSFLQQTHSNPLGIRVVFLGDSITEGWSYVAKSIWEQQYASRGAVNYGISGDRTQHILWRIRHGELAGLKPKLVVLKIGTNNLGGATEDEIARGIQTIVQDLRRMLPQTRILLLGVLPRNNIQWISDAVKRINTAISTLDDGYSIRYLDMTSSFQNSPVQVKPELYNPDLLHLAVPGYQMWYQTMEPLFYNMYHN